MAARSISRPAADMLRRTPFIAHVLAAFDQACDLVTPNGDVIAVVTMRIGDGPLNIIVEATAGALAAVEQDAPVELDGDTLRIGRLEITLEGALTWEPCPDWSALRARLKAIVANLPALRAIALSHAAAGSLLTASSALDYVNSPYRAACGGEARNPGLGWERNTSRLQEAAAHLAGLGIGLTPAGDDFLVGIMLWAWLAHPAPGPLCRTLVEVAAPRTTTLSAAFLRAAARGECDANWHQLLAALSSGSAAQLAPIVQKALARGATSGADTLAGFLWLAAG